MRHNKLLDGYSLKNNTFQNLQMFKLLFWKSCYFEAHSGHS